MIHTIFWKLYGATLLIAAAVLPATGLAAQQQKVHEFREVHLGMEVRLLLYGDSLEAERVARVGFLLIDSLDMKLSDWSPDSELRLLERLPIGWWHPISPELRDVLLLSLRVAAATEGRLDPTIGSLTRLWREALRSGVDPTEVAARKAKKAGRHLPCAEC